MPNRARAQQLSYLRNPQPFIGHSSQAIEPGGNTWPQHELQPQTSEQQLIDSPPDLGASFSDTLSSASSYGTLEYPAFPGPIPSFVNTPGLYQAMDIGSFGTSHSSRSPFDSSSNQPSSDTFIWTPQERQVQHNPLLPQKTATAFESFPGQSDQTFFDSRHLIGSPSTLHSIAEAPDPSQMAMGIDLSYPPYYVSSPFSLDSSTLIGSPSELGTPLHDTWSPAPSHNTRISTDFRGLAPSTFDKSFGSLDSSQMVMEMDSSLYEPYHASGSPLGSSSNWPSDTLLSQDQPPSLFHDPERQRIAQSPYAYSGLDAAILDPQRSNTGIINTGDNTTSLDFTFGSRSSINSRADHDGPSVSDSRTQRGTTEEIFREPDRMAEI